MARQSVIESEPLLNDTDACINEVTEDEMESEKSQAELENFKAPVTFRLYIAVVAACFAAMAMGSVLGYSSPAFTTLESNSSRVIIIPKSPEESWTGSLINLGALAGGMVGGIMADTFGRKLTVIVISFPFIAGWGVIIGAQQVWMLYLGRILTGLSMGVVSMTIPTYISEVSPPAVRGLLGSFFQLSVTIGILVVYAAGISLDWVWLAVLSAVFPAVCAVLMFFMPESPYWLTQHDRAEDTRKALVFLRGQNESINTELRSIEIATTSTEGQHAGIRDLFKKDTLIPLMISTCLMFFQQFSGINAVLFYAANIFESAGSSMSASVSAVVIAVVMVIATAVASVLMDRAGRRILLMLSASIMAVSLAALGAYYKVVSDSHHNATSTLTLDLSESDTDVSKTLSWLPLTSLVVYVIAFSIGSGPIPWLMMSEIFPSKTRGMASSLATTINWSFSFIVTFTFNSIVLSIHEYGAYWMYTAILCVYFVFVLFIVPETKGKSLEAIEKYFQEGNVVYLFRSSRL